MNKEIEKWKENFFNVYQITIGDESKEIEYNFIFREIGKQEYNNLISTYSRHDELQEAVCEVCVLSPSYDFSKGLGGIAETLSNYIVEYSNLMRGQAEELLAVRTNEMEYFDYQIECIIHEAFPSFTLEEISNWTIDRIMYYFSRAQWILENLRGTPLKITQENPKQEDVEQQQYDYSFTNSDNKAENHSDLKEDETSSDKEAELLQMLAQNQGSDINPPEKELRSFPEESWFKTQDYLKGDFD